MTGTLHHVMGRGIERTTLLQGEVTRADFVARVAALARDGHWVAHAWALLPNHFHGLVRTGERPLCQSMRKLLTGYVVNFNGLALSAELPEFRQSVNMLWSLRVPHPGPSATRGRTPRGIFFKDITLDPLQHLGMTIRLEATVAA